MQFQVPQFIEVEDKIFGPFTWRQFVYLAGGAGIIFLIYEALPFFFAVFFIIPVAALSLALAFYKINERPFIVALEALFKHLMRNKLYTWKKIEREKPRAEKAQSATAESLVPRLGEGKLKDLAWSLDVHESIYAGEEKNRRGAAEGRG